MFFFSSERLSSASVYWVISLSTDEVYFILFPYQTKSGYLSLFTVTLLQPLWAFLLSVQLSFATVWF